MDHVDMEYTNEDQTILSKLGILQSTLECPKKKLHSKVSMKKVGCTGASNSKNVQVSSDDSSDDCLFDNERFSQNRKRRRPKNKSVLRLENGHPHKFSHWHTLSLLSVFLFIGLSATSRDLFALSYTSSDRTNFFTGFSASFGFSYILGCLLAGSTFSRLNTFAIFLMLMVLSMPISLLIVWKSTILSFNWIAFLAGTLMVSIERGGLLVSSLSHNHQRTFFSLYMAMSLGSLVASLLMSNSSTVLLSEDMQFKAVSTSIFSKMVVKRDVGNQSALIAPAPITPPLFGNSTSPQLEDVLSGTTISAASQQIDGSTTKIAPDLSKLVFQSKTEENMIRRKEVEQRQKEKLATSTTPTTTTSTSTTATSTTPLPTSTTPPTTTTTAAPTTPTTSSTTMTPNTSPSITITTSPPTTTQPTISNTSHLPSEGNMSVQPWNIASKFPKSSLPSSSHTITQITLTILMAAMPLPLLIAFCCCRLSTSLLPDARLLEMLNKAKEKMALDAEPAGCRALSSLIWVLHTVIESLLLVFLPMSMQGLVGSQGVGSQSAVLVNTLIWFPATIVRLFFVVRPSLGGSNASVIHLFYCTSILVHLLVHSLMPVSETRLMATALVAGLFSCSLPLMVYNWLGVFLEADPLHLSGRFLVSQGIGRMLGTHALNWLVVADKMSTSSTQQSIGMSLPIERLLSSLLCLLLLTYALFIWLSTSVHRAKRQMKIIQLSGAITGEQQPTTEAKTNGQYMALLENGDQSNDEENEVMGFILTEGEESDRSFV